MIFIVINLVNVCVLCQTSILSEDIKLRSGDTLILPYGRTTEKEYVNSLSCWWDPGVIRGIKVDNIYKKYKEIVVSEPLLRVIGFDSLDKKMLINDMKDAIEYSYISVTPITFYVFYTFGEDGGSPSIYHKAIRIKKIREFITNICGDILVELCKYYPKDFKEKIINTINYCLNFINTEMPKHKYEIVKGHLFIDKELLPLSPAQAYNWDKFIIRRIIKDEIPKEEINLFLNNLLQKIQTIDVSNNKDILRKTTINNELTYCYSTLGDYFIINNKKNILYDEKRRKDMFINKVYFLPIIKLQYVKDGYGNPNYIIEYEYYDKYNRINIKKILMINKVKFCTKNNYNKNI